MTPGKFDNWKARCHYLYTLCGEAKGKSNLQKYNEATETYNKTWDEYDALENKTTKKAEALLAKCGNAEAEMDRLESIKDVPHLSSGCKSKLREIWVEEARHVKKQIKNKYLEKGLLLEEDAITMYSQITGEFHKKNKVRLENEYICGEIDFSSYDAQAIVDTKVSWDIFTFYDSFFGEIDDDYEWQQNGYMWLNDKFKAHIAYCLLNTPEHLIVAEERRLMYDMFGNEANMARATPYELEVYQEEKEQIRKRHTHDHIPLKERMKVFEVLRDEAKIERIKEVITGCRWYLNKLNESICS